MLNKISMIARLTREPETRSTSVGGTVANVGLACNRKHEEREEVLFIDATVWGKRAEAFVKHFSKGDLVYVEGRLTQDRWTGDDGKERTKIKITVENWEFPSSLLGQRLVTERAEGA